MSLLSCGDDEVVVLSSGDDGNMFAWDAKSGAVACTFKNCLSVNSGVVSVDGKPCRSSRPVSHSLLSAQRDKPFIHMWNWGKDQVHLRCAAPERMTCLSTTCDGGFLFGAGPSGKIYCWELASGALLGSWFAHYKAVSSLAMMQGSSVLVSGGEDAVVHAWNVPSVVDTLIHDSTGRIAALQSFSGHTLQVTSVRVGAGFLSGRIYSTSLDRLCNVWSLHSATPLATIVHPCPLTTGCADSTDTRLFTGGSDGLICGTDLHVTALHQTALGAAHKPKTLQHYRGHTRAVTDLRVGPSGTWFVSSSEDGSVRVWDVLSCQSLRSFDTHKSPVRSVLLVAKSPSWFGLGKKTAPAFVTVSHLRKHTSAVADAGTWSLHVHPAAEPASVMTRLALESGSTAVVSSGPTPEEWLHVTSEAESLKAELARLTQENARWQAVNTQLLQRLHGGAVAAGPAGTSEAAPDTAPAAHHSDDSADDVSGDEAAATATPSSHAHSHSNKKRKRRKKVTHPKH